MGPPPGPVIAFLVPGQGAQRPGMLGDLPDTETVRAVLSRISDDLGSDVHRLDTADALRSTAAAQVALFAVAVAASAQLAAEDVVPDVVAGHSVGAFAAAVMAGVLTVPEALAAVRARARLMERAYPSGYGMIAVLGIGRRAAERLVAEAGRDDLFVAIENAADQIVLSGSDRALRDAAGIAPRFGARRVRRLDVAVPSHCVLLQPVADELAALLATVPDRRPTIRYLAGSSGRPAPDGARVRDDLAQGVARMVRWRDVTDLLVELGVDTVAQFPPGRATAALAIEAHPGLGVVALADAPWADSVLRLRRLLGEAGGPA